MKKEIFDGQVSSMFRFKMKTQYEEEVRYILIGQQRDGITAPFRFWKRI